MPAGDSTYELTVTAKGFQGYKASGIALSGSEKRNINVTLTVGATTETVEVTGMADQLVPVDSGEKSATLTTKELNNFIIVGSNAAEFLKIMPGFGINNGTSNKASFSGEVIGINGNGDGGSQSSFNNAYSVQRTGRQLTRHHGGRRTRVGPRLQLRHAGQSEHGHDLRSSRF